MKICPLGAELFHADGRTDMTKLKAVFSNCANAPKNEMLLELPTTFHTLKVAGYIQQQLTWLNFNFFDSLNMLIL